MRDPGDPESPTMAMAVPAIPEDMLQRDRACLVVLTGPDAGEIVRVHGRVLIGRASDADVRFLDERVSRRHARISVEWPEIWIEDLGSLNGTFVDGVRIHRQPLRGGEKIHIGAAALLRFELQDQLDESFQYHMCQSALRDPLTGVYNRRYLFERLRSEFAYARRHGTSLSLLLVDIDDFKGVNDTHGHLVGDAVLAAIARHVSGIVRAEDVFARFGGEEFAVLARGIAVEGAYRFAERLRSAIESHPVRDGDRVIPVTVSVGVASLPAPGIETVDDLVGCADRALYEAKRGGRNRVCVAGKSFRGG
jgi:diguanylate cyclase (GGDEF)-like protein